ncbi:MAG TPA: hypothetical protein PLT93_11665 [Phycisphaerae bacterium]|nr:hypothetical protein [Phycisphaerae bacterium]
MSEVESYRAMSAGELSKILLVEYRCARGCLLLHVYSTPQGAKYFRPALRVSKNMQWRTGMAEVGRVGEAAGLLTDLSADRFTWGDAVNWIMLGCPHVIGVRFPASDVLADASSAKAGNPVKNHSFWMTDTPPR